LHQFINADTWAETRRIVEAHPELLTDAADALLGRLVDAAREEGDEEAVRLLEEHRALLRRCREVGVERAFAERGGATELIEVLQAFLTADTWAESRRIVEAHPELLTDAADALLGRMVDAAREKGDERAVRLFEEHRALLRRCREAGVEQAFAERGGATQIPPEFQDDLRQAQEGVERGDLAALDQAIAAWKRILTHSAFAHADERFRLAAWNDAGGAYLRRYWVQGQWADLEAAIEYAQRAVDLTPQDSPDLLNHLNNLGLGLRDPVESWGVLLYAAQNVRSIAHMPWLLIPGLFVVLAVLAFNFVGDGMRDAADPYSK